MDSEGDPSWPFAALARHPSGRSLRWSRCTATDRRRPAALPAVPRGQVWSTRGSECSREWCPQWTVAPAASPAVSIHRQHRYTGKQNTKKHKQGNAHLLVLIRHGRQRFNEEPPLFQRHAKAFAIRKEELDEIRSSCQQSQAVKRSKSQESSKDGELTNQSIL